jgi:tetratricopeptide (TPR) repeat protein
MKRPQLLVVGVAIVAAVGLLALPKGIIRNTSKPGAPSTAGANRDSGVAPAVDASGGAAATTEHDHDGDGTPDHAATDPNATPEHPHREISAAERQELTKLRAAFRAETQPASRAGRAAELAGKYAAAQLYDSAGYYYEQAAAARPGEKYAQLAADQYFEAFGFAATPQRGEQLSKKAQDLYQQVLKANPTNLRAKTNLAMTYVASPQPMQGIFLLREVLAAEPTNELALYNIGMLSMQSGQTEKAVGRFQELVKAHPKNLNGHFYLGVTLAQLGKAAEARTAFKQTLALSPDPQLRASVEQELAKLPK